ncbi:hypothetical protein [Telmatospirillum siberiense]|nr:hypothetical protein [Telmatospirillum siberiense]
MNEPGVADKLKVLLPHWIEHNDRHVAELRRWRRALHDQAPLAASMMDMAITQMEDAGRALAATARELAAKETCRGVHPRAV